MIFKLLSLSLSPSLALFNYNFKFLLFHQGEEAIHVMENVMFVLPGLEGCAAALEPLCRRLKIKVCALQLGVEHKNENLEMMVNRLHQVRPCAETSTIILQR